MADLFGSPKIAQPAVPAPQPEKDVSRAASILQKAREERRVSAGDLIVDKTDEVNNGTGLRIGQ